MMELDEKTLIIDPKEISPGKGHIRKWGSRRVFVCRSEGTIKIFEIEEETEEKPKSWLKRLLSIWCRR